MPYGDATDPIPESLMRFLRPIGLALAAVLIGANGSALLLLAVGWSLGWEGWNTYVMPVAVGASLLMFMWLMVRSRRKRAQAERDGVTLEPAGPVRALVSGVMVGALGAWSLWLGLRGESQSGAAVAGGWVLLAMGISTLSRVPARWRERQARARGGGPRSAGK